MNAQLDGLSEEELTAYADMLLDTAKARIAIGDRVGAAWRVANVLGILSVLIPYDNSEQIPGINTRTMLGYRLEPQNAESK